MLSCPEMQIEKCRRRVARTRLDLRLHRLIYFIQCSSLLGGVTRIANGMQKTAVFQPPIRLLTTHHVTN